MKKVLCIMSEQFEELEAVGTIALLRRAGIEVSVCSLHDHKATGRFQITLSDLMCIEEANISEYDALFLPGGPHYKELLENKAVQQIIHAFHTQTKYICAICAAPTILGHLGILKNRQYTCFTSMNEDFGGTYIDKYTALDGHIITGRSAAAVIDFSFVIIEQLLGKEKAEEVKNSIYYYQS